MIEIKHSFTGAVLFRSEAATTVREAVLAAVAARADLADADLARADLAGADLARADLARAYLANADLAGADLADEPPEHHPRRARRCRRGDDHRRPDDPARHVDGAVKYAVIYLNPYGEPQAGPPHERAEWFDTEEAAQKWAEKVLRETTCRIVRIAQVVATVHAEPVWVKQ